MRMLAYSIFVIAVAVNVGMAQSDSLQWSHLVKSHDTTEVFYDDYINSFWCSYGPPLVFVDTIIVVQPNQGITAPIPVQGLKAFVDSIKYPPLALRAGVMGVVILTASIDSFGLVHDVKVKQSSAEIFNKNAITALENARFTTPMIKGHSTDVRIAIVLSFAIQRRKNVEIDKIIVDRSACLGTCPSYTVTLDKDGTVLYDGRYYAKRAGKWKAQMDKSQFVGITSLLFAIRFFEMKETYATGATDLPWITITVKTPNETKKVSTDYYAPLGEISVLVDYATENLKWEKVEQ
ncbi:MAG TPA: TonB family protein [Candidatus Kryptonia bacterium]